MDLSDPEGSGEGVEPFAQRGHPGCAVTSDLPDLRIGGKDGNKAGLRGLLGYGPESPESPPRSKYPHGCTTLGLVGSSGWDERLKAWRAGRSPGCNQSGEQGIAARVLGRRDLLISEQSVEQGLVGDPGSANEASMIEALYRDVPSLPKFWSSNFQNGRKDFRTGAGRNPTLHSLGVRAVLRAVPGTASLRLDPLRVHRDP